jgi:hypothetical protein
MGHITRGNRGLGVFRIMVVQIRGFKERDGVGGFLVYKDIPTRQGRYCG